MTEVKYKVFNRFTQEEITNCFEYFLRPDGVLFFFDYTSDELIRAGNVHEVKYDKG